MVAAARRNHFSLGKADVLPGNVGYLELRGFSGSPEAEDAVVSALNYLQYTDAMIFDLRRNGGGSAELVNFVISHFTGSDTLASLTVSNRSGGEKFTRYTLASVPGPRRTDVPVYVLTSGYTASAGEDFAFVLKNLGRAQVIGQPTAGAGHNNAFLDAGHGFSVSVSFTRVSDPKTGAEWERIGVQPNVVVDQADALLTAQSLALKAISARAGSDKEQQQMLAATKEWIDAQLSPRTVSAATLSSYAGEYEGGRKVWVVGDKLLYSPRPGAPADTLVALSDTLFANIATRVGFEKTGTGAPQLRVTGGGGSLTYGRVK
jgi:C-terminal processing protease CtpA/Prc